jgi:toxin ParE1/3/4
MAHRLAPQARADLSIIWNYIVKESGNVAAADGVIDAITERVRDDLRPGLRSFAVGEYVIVYTIEAENAEILFVFHGRQDIEGQLGQ